MDFDAEAVPLCYCNTTNYGDRVSPDIVGALGGVATQHRTTGRKLLGIGSILWFAETGDAVWGTGAMTPELWVQSPENLAIYAVRGPLTRDALLRHGLSCPAVYGDPGMFIPRLFPVVAPAERKGLGIVTHYVDVDYADRLRQMYPGAQIIDPTQPVAAVTLAISSCSTILSSSLHGLVAAEAMGIPAGWLRLSDRVAGDGFKFRDYYLGSGRDIQEPGRMGDMALAPPAKFAESAMLEALRQCLADRGITW